MTVKYVLAILVAVGLGCCEGVQPKWANLKAHPETWKCLTLGNSCSSATEPFSCCEGQCCSDGKCKPCGSSEVGDSPAASFVASTFTDFVGRQFEFPGGEGEVYSLVTEADHQVNAILQPLDSESQELGITMRGVGIHGPDTSVHVFVEAEGRLTVQVNGRPFSGTQLRLDGVTIIGNCPPLQCDGHFAGGSAVTVTDSFLTLWIWTAAPGRKLNFRASVTNKPMSQVHGILGQTLGSHGSYVAATPTTRVALPSNLQFYGEGQLSDYSTTDLFSSDSTFSMFARKAERRMQRRKRTMLEGNALAAMALASREGAKRGPIH